MLFLPDRSLKVYMNLRTLVSEQQRKVREGSIHAVRFGYGNNTKFELVPKIRSSRRRSSIKKGSTCVEVSF